MAENLLPARLEAMQKSLETVLSITSTHATKLDGVKSDIERLRTEVKEDIEGIAGGLERTRTDVSNLKAEQAKITALTAESMTDRVDIWKNVTENRKEIATAKIELTKYIGIGTGATAGIQLTGKVFWALLITFGGAAITGIGLLFKAQQAISVVERMVQNGAALK